MGLFDDANDRFDENKKIELYKTLYSDLVSLASVAGVNEVELQQYFIPHDLTEPRGYLFCLCSALQNSGRMRNSIKFNDKNALAYKEAIKSAMCDFNAEAAAAKYNNWKEIYNAIMSMGISDNGSGKKKYTNWQKYCMGLYDGLKFLTDKNSEGITGEIIINELVNSTEFTEEKIKSISRIEKRIYGLGFALTCDWLKECGCVWLAKPDVHINAVVMRLNGEDKINDKDVLNEMFKWANEVKESGADSNITAYKLDKIIWLLCTGEFYLHNTHIGRDAIFKRIDAKNKV